MKNECNDCENWIERGDILFDETCQLRREIESMEVTIETINELRVSNAELRKLLYENNINFDI